LIFTGEDNPFQKLHLQIIGAAAEFERSLARERQKEGIAIAKAEGKYKGRKAKLTPEQISHIRDKKQKGEKVAKLAKEYTISRQALYQSFKREARPDRAAER
jgi:DNA invertase Pin-like site-specific DNA recombinase